MKHRSLITVMMVAGISISGQVTQTDWSEGPGYSGPLTEWGPGFQDTEDVAWLSIPGQIALSSDTLADPVLHVVETGTDGAYTADTGDMDGDGDTDIVVGLYSAGELAVWYADGSGGWNRETVSMLIQGPCGCDVTDIDDDGDMDILCATYTGGRVLLFQNDGSTTPGWTESEISPSFAGGHDVEGCDMDGDGDIDILAASAESDRVSWWRNDGGSPIQWHEQNISDSVDYPCRIQGADLDGDGCMDVVASMWQGSEVVAWYGSGGGNPSWTEQKVYSPVYGAHSVRATDIDGDGDRDLVVAEMGGGRLLLFRNEGGSPVSWSREVTGTFPSCAYARTGDIDGDGDPDILTSSFASAGARWYENDGSAGSWPSHQVTSGQGSISCAIPADIDGDGDLDALLTAYGQDKVLWCEVTCYRDSGWLIGSVLDLEETPQWSSIEWGGSIPGGTDVSLCYRTSDDPGSMGDWSAPLYTPTELSGLLGRYFQYRIQLETSVTSRSPVIEWVRLNWDPNWVEEAEESSELAVFLTSGNPSRRPIAVTLCSQVACSVTLSLFDISGRIVWAACTELERECESDLILPSLPSGAYRLQVSVRDGTAQTFAISQI